MAQEDAGGHKSEAFWLDWCGDVGLSLGRLIGGNSRQFSQLSGLHVAHWHRI